MSAARRANRAAENRAGSLSAALTCGSDMESTSTGSSSAPLPLAAGPWNSVSCAVSRGSSFTCSSQSAARSAWAVTVSRRATLATLARFEASMESASEKAFLTSSTPIPVALASASDALTKLRGGSLSPPAARTLTVLSSRAQTAAPGVRAASRRLENAPFSGPSTECNCGTTTIVIGAMTARRWAWAGRVRGWPLVWWEGNLYARPDGS